MKKLLSLSLALLLVVMSIPQMAFAQESFTVSVDTVETTSAIANLSRELTGTVTATLSPAEGTAMVSGTTVTMSGLTPATSYELTVSEDVDVYEDNRYDVHRDYILSYYYYSPNSENPDAKNYINWDQVRSVMDFDVLGKEVWVGYWHGAESYYVDVTEKIDMPPMDATDTFTTAADTFTLDITAVNGSVARSSDGPYAPGTEVTLTANPDTNYHFAGWSNDLGSTEEITVTMNENMSLTASFAINTYPVTFYDDNGEDVLFGSFDVDHGNTVPWPLPSEPTKSGFVFNGWKVGDVAFDPTQAITELTNVSATWLPVNLYFTVDNEMKIYHNGVELSPVFRPTTGSHEWQRIKYYFADLAEGDVIAIEGTDEGVIAGMMGEIHLGASVYPTQTDSHWKQSTVLQEGWNNKGFAMDESWDNVYQKSSNQWVGLQGVPAGFDAEWVWSENNDYPNGGDRVVYFRYVIGGYVPPQPEMVTITFDTDGGSTVSPISIPQGTSLDSNEMILPIPSKDGFDFDKWIYGESEIFDGTTEVAQTMTVFALYTEQDNDDEPEDEEENDIPVQPTQPVEPQGPQGNVTINYVSTDGTVLASPFTFTGTVGSNYVSTARTFEGYELVETPANATGSFAEAGVVVNYVYTDGTEEVTEEDVALGDATVDPVDEPEDETDEAIEEVVLNEEVPLAEALPKTGHLPAELFMGIGGLISAVGVYLKKK